MSIKILALSQDFNFDVAPEPDQLKMAEQGLQKFNDYALSMVGGKLQFETPKKGGAYYWSKTKIGDGEYLVKIHIWQQYKTWNCNIEIANNFKNR